MSEASATQPAIQPDWTVPVRELLELPELGLRVLAGESGLDREVSWAHVSELVDPTEFLRGGELLLLTGVSLPAGPHAQHTYVRRLAAAGVAAVGFGTGLTWAEVPPALVAAAERAGMPLLEVPRAVPFLAITRAVAAAIVRRERASQERLAAARRALTSAAVGPAGLAGVADELRRLTGGWALLLNRAGGVLANSPASAAGRAAELAGELAKLRDAPGAASMLTERGAWVQSLTAGAEVLGYLAVQAAALTSVDRQVVNAAVPLCVLSLDRSRLVDRATARLRAGVLRLLLAGQRELVAGAADELWNGLPAEPVRLLACRGSRFLLAEASHRLAQRLAAARVLYAELDGALVVLAGDAEVPAVLNALAGTSARRAGTAERSAGRSGTSEVSAGRSGASERTSTRVGLSEPAGYAQLDRALGQAHRALSAGTGPVTWFRDLPRLELPDLLPAEVAAEFTDATLRPLRELDRGGELARSARVWLAHHGQWDPAAHELGVHRHTLRNRIRKLERLLGRSLDAPEVRAELWLALELERRGHPGSG
jgi:PucR family transcriptional regulator, purine catabolism regulatory protein